MLFSNSNVSIWNDGSYCSVLTPTVAFWYLSRTPLRLMKFRTALCAILNR